MASRRKLPSGLAESIRTHQEENKKSKDMIVAAENKIQRRKRIDSVSDGEIEAALEICNGNISQTAETLEVNRGALSKRIRESGQLREFRSQIYQRMIDEAEDTIFQKIREEGQIGLRAATFILERIGGDRGWREKKEVAVSEQDLTIIQGAVQATISKFVRVEDQVEAKKYFMEQIKDGIQARRVEAPDNRGEAVIVS